MNTETICSALEGILPKEQIHENELMSRHTTFRIGGPASCLLEICNKQELSGVLDLLHREALPYFVLGNGSNLLVGDKRGQRVDDVGIGIFGAYTHIGPERDEGLRKSDRARRDPDGAGHSKPL